MYTQTQIETKLDAEIQSVLGELKNHEKTSEEYGALVDRIARLHKLKIEEIEQTTKIHKMELEAEEGFDFKQVSPDTVLAVAANIFGILWLARYERENVIKSRSALGFVMKPR